MSRVMSPNGVQVPVIAIANPTIPALNPFLAILYQQFLLKNVWLEYFAFSATWNTLLANAAGQQQTITIDPSIDFLVMQINLTAYSDVNTIVQSPNYLLEIQEKSGRSNWSDAAIHVNNWTGQSRDAGAVSYELPIPQYVRGNNTISCKLTNRTAVAAVVDLALMGLRITYNNASRVDLFGVPF